MIENYNRARLIVDVKKMSFTQTIKELEKMRNKTSEYGNFPVVIINEWIDDAKDTKMDLFTWMRHRIEKEHTTAVLSQTYHNKNQVGNYDALHPDLANPKAKK